MIISRIDGGLGNQMFQYAYGLYLARRHSTELVLDTSSFQSRPQHGYLLDKFCIQARPADETHQRLIPQRYRIQQPDSWFKRLPFTGLRRHKEVPFGFRTEHLATPNHRYLVGYWQSEHFFPGLRAELLNHFQLHDRLSEQSQRVCDRIRHTNSAVLHIRRGDYVTDQRAASIYHRLDGEYYRSSLADWAASQRQLEVFVFSNDIPWCREHIELPWKTHWVDHTTNHTAHEDLVLMSQAACCVIANSTFSWWAAWLNNRPDKVVYAPSAWFAQENFDGSNIIPPTWKQTSAATERAA